MKQVAGYKFRGINYCNGDCIIEVLILAGVASPAARDSKDMVEDTLDYLADCMAINRKDQPTFNSYDFPKVLFLNHLRYISCGKCYKSIGA